MNKCLLILLFCLVTSCTYSITMVHTEGDARDVVDETATSSATTDLSVPSPM